MAKKFTFDELLAKRERREGGRVKNGGLAGAGGGNRPGGRGARQKKGVGP